MKYYMYLAGVSMNVGGYLSEPWIERIFWDINGLLANNSE
jgi:hypothetical protein